MYANIMFPNTWSDLEIWESRQELAGIFPAMKIDWSQGDTDDPCVDAEGVSDGIVYNILAEI